MHPHRTNSKNTNTQKPQTAIVNIISSLGLFKIRTNPNPIFSLTLPICVPTLPTGQLNCPSGRDESEEECGTARRLLELPGGMFAALGCVAAAVTACLIFCIFGLVRRKRKSNARKHLLNGSASASALGSSASGTLQRSHHHHSQHHLHNNHHHNNSSHSSQNHHHGLGGLGTYHPGGSGGGGLSAHSTLRREKHAHIGGGYGKKDSLFMDADVAPS